MVAEPDEGLAPEPQPGSRAEAATTEGNPASRESVWPSSAGDSAEPQLALEAEPAIEAGPPANTPLRKRPRTRPRRERAKAE